MIEDSCRKIVAFELLASFVLSFVNVYVSAASFAFTLISALFFRDPPRIIGEGVVSPADGKVDYVSGRRLEIFMNIFDCHVNRSPVSGKVVRVTYTPGKFPPAFMRNRSVKTAERNEIWIDSGEGLFKVTQIAGFLARRIVCHVREGDHVVKGQKLGMIRFGSRVVLEVPEGYEFVKGVGDRLKAGETVAVRKKETA